jgi:hypothetical protein
MVVAFIVACFIGTLSLILIQLYEHPHLSRKVLIHIGIVLAVPISLAIAISCFSTEPTFTHITQHADYYIGGNLEMHFSKVLKIDYDIEHFDWRSWRWLNDGSIAHLIITDDNGNKIVTE